MRCNINYIQFQLEERLMSLDSEKMRSKMRTGEMLRKNEEDEAERRLLEWDIFCFS